MAELLPCPFCGSITQIRRAPISGMYMFQCDYCGANTSFYKAEFDKNKAVNKYNTRTPKERCGEK